ncbi:hypothetical protein FQ154_01605 [Paeniglutamicibacter gangotriensis]|uniref:Uncharacterized protein n=1 Tax=Paeniglutamicibacter gangotriensis TaxID=254787 RepID=A0A5B0EPV6_9MICC|nr:hypothetical protein [Paeniglutamicibacter gangotriensis]KAA0979881.1 hypothetical protein FQ154_01605 [Paeniglutamicibacter gangotriensis]
MSKTIPGVPESVTREQWLSFFTAAGITPELTKSLRFEPEGIYATVFEAGPEGRRIVTDSNGYAKHEIFIPINDETPSGV